MPKSAMNTGAGNDSGTINNRFQVISALGEGGFGKVLLVHDSALRDVCALKLLRPELACDASTQAKFAKEAAIWLEVGKHPHVVTLRALDYFNGRLYLALEFIPPSDLGINTLDKRIRRWRIGTTLAAKWGIHLCRGMRHAIAKGLIAHRDLKPSNLMIDPGDTLKITDFGLAIFAVDPSNRLIDTSPSGTPVYMAPEQFVGGTPVDHRSDIYSVGLILYEMASGGGLPFHVECVHPQHYFAYFHHIHRTYALPPLDSPLYHVISRCLRKEREARYQSFSDVERDLQQVYTATTGRGLPEISQDEMTVSEHVNRAVSYSLLRDAPRAMEQIEKALALAPSFSTALNNKASFLAQMGRVAEAKAIWRGLARDAPQMYMPFYNLGNVSMQSGDHKTAIQFYKATLGREPAYVPAIVNMAICHQNAGEVTTAISLYDQALAVAPNDAQIAYNKAVLVLDNGDPAGALVLFQRVLELSPQHVSAHNYLGVCFRTLAQPEQALECFNRALQINPQYSFALKNRQELMEEQKDRKGGWRNILGRN